MSQSSAEMINGFSAADLGRLDADKQQMIERRSALLGESYKLFYRRPVHFVRAEGVWLFDPEGNAYLDAYNNVPAVGHCHPRVVAAIGRQAKILNTHTRYLHEGILNYSADLLATFPPEVRHIMYTCTGSEAVDLALRIARYRSKKAGIIVTANAYHGVTSATSELSPALGPNVEVARSVYLVRAPNQFRCGIDVGEQLASDVEQAIVRMQRDGVGFAGLLADMIFSTDGVLADPVGFLQRTVEIVHRHGGVFIADEVQPGFGRTGVMWGFQRHGIVPDLVVMGKPMGNGMPIAAVAMRPEISAEFEERVRYFNTFGANTVSIAAAQAVLDVIRDERLIQNAATTGAYLLDGLRAIAAKEPRIGDVRGAGLFIGVELVKPDGEPDGATALDLVNSLRERRVLISASSPHGNVLKIRPPLPFSTKNADTFLNALTAALEETK